MRAPSESFETRSKVGARSAAISMKPVLLLTIRLYQRLISPLLPPACRYVPTCSEYAAEAVEIHGPWKGAVLAGWRLLHCHPLSRGGYQPVPSPRPHTGAAHRLL